MTIVNAMVVVSIVLMPLFIFLFLDNIQPRYFAIALISMFAARFLMQFKTLPVQKSISVWMVLMLIGMGVIAFADNSTMLLSYPVLMNAGFLCLFLFTLIFPPTIVEKIARLQDPDLPEAGVQLHSSSDQGMVRVFSDQWLNCGMDSLVWQSSDLGLV